MGMTEQEKLLKIEMIKYGDTRQTLSDYLGVARQTLSRKMKTGNFKPDEMLKMRTRYKMSDELFVKIFGKGAFSDEHSGSGAAVK